MSRLKASLQRMATPYDNFLNSFLSPILFCRRWELFHGHNSDGVQWDASSKNPRIPNTLSFDSVRHVMDSTMMTTTKGDSKKKLSTASQAISDLVDNIQSEINRQQILTESKVMKDVLPNAVESNNIQPMQDIRPMETDSTLPPSVPSGDTTLKVQQLDISSETVGQLSLAAYLLSPASIGLYDELLALVKTGVIEISSSGVPILIDDWSTKVDYFVLQDMEDHWKNDTLNRYCLSSYMKETLEQEWIYEDDIWALASDPDDIIYNVQELEEWRQFFQGQMEAQTNQSEGIGGFGL